jgi:hypothetical protein
MRPTGWKEHARLDRLINLCSQAPVAWFTRLTRCCSRVGGASGDPGAGHTALEVTWNTNLISRAADRSPCFPLIPMFARPFGDAPSSAFCINGRTCKEPSRRVGKCHPSWAGRPSRNGVDHEYSARDGRFQVDLPAVDPIRNRDCSDMPTLPNKIDDCPMFIAPL